MEESPSGSEFVGEESGPEGDLEGEVDESDDGEEEEVKKREKRKYSVKEEIEFKSRYPPPIRGKPNAIPCGACTKRNQTCYSQDSLKARGACYRCGKLKIRCIYPVSLFFFKILINYSNCFN